MPQTCFHAAQYPELLGKHAVSAKELTRAALRRIAKAEPCIGAFLLVADERAHCRAAELDAALREKRPVPALAGVPIAVKDNICAAGIATTCASRMLEHFVPFYDATAVSRLNDAGAVLVGKANLDEFAMGCTGEHSCFHPTRNPWDTGHVPGGSSSGSAAAVAAGMVPLALGSDTGGSVRTPASYCGIVGLKPTYGAVSRYGLIAFAPSFEQIGTLARTVDDTALLFSVISGADKEHDATSRDALFDSMLKGGVKGLKLGVPKEYFDAGVNDEVKSAVEQAIALLASLGAEIVGVSLPSTQYALPAYRILSSAEASSNLSRFDGLKYGYSAEKASGFDELCRRSRGQGFGSEVKRRILLGTLVLSHSHRDGYARALQARCAVAQEFDASFLACDALITPTTPATAPKLGEAEQAAHGDMADRFTVPANLAGLPALSVPCGFSAAGLPIGMQIIGPKWAENRILRIAKQYEQAVGGFQCKEPDI